MTVTLGDRAYSMTFQSRSAELKTTIARLTDELSSGQTSDVSRRLGGDLSYLSDLEQGRAKLESYSISAREAAVQAEAAQTAVSRVVDISQGLGADLIALGSSALQPITGQAAREASDALQDMIGALNGSAAGRQLFSGTVTDQPPLNSAEALLQGLKTAVTGLSDPADIEAAAAAWFSDPGGFRAEMYQGGDQSMAPIQLSETETVTLDIRADAPEFGAVLQAAALAVLATDEDLALAPETRAELQRNAGEALLSAQDDLTDLGAHIGTAEARIEEVQTRQASARTAMDYAKGSLLEADPYQVATELEAVQFRLESLYTVTARSAQLSLVNFLR